jgi:hypothetical protein
MEIRALTLHPPSVVGLGLIDMDASPLGGARAVVEKERS